jgi:hypothetical protein
MQYFKDPKVFNYEKFTGEKWDRLMEMAANYDEYAPQPLREMPPQQPTMSSWDSSTKSALPTSPVDPPASSEAPS